MKMLPDLRLRYAATFFAFLGIIMMLFPVRSVSAASVTTFSDTLSTVKQSTAANHTISFVTPTGVGSGQNITLTIGGAATFSGMASIVFGDVDVADNGTDLTLASSASGATWGISTSATVLTITSGTGTITAGHTITVKIGTNATFSTTGTNQLTNPTAGIPTLTIGGSFGDSGKVAISVITDDSVNVTADIGASLSFSVSDNTIGFGTLSSANARYATGDTSGNTSEVAGHTMTISTNAAMGYAITYTGATLTDTNAHTIPVATITSDADGTPGSSQFAMSASTDGASTIGSGYEQASNNWKYIASTTTNLVTKATPVSSTETISAYYLANISGTQQPGSYSTNITYIATGTF